MNRYGSVISTHVLKTPDLADRVASVILIDPISILLHQPDVAYNFVRYPNRDTKRAALVLTPPQTARKPKLPSEWLLWYFGSKDIGVAHTLSRTFFWSENILWKEDLSRHRTTVFLGSKDSIINASQVRTYLENTGRTTLQHATEVEKEVPINGEPIGLDRHLSVVWCEGLNHGQVFDLLGWRTHLRDRTIGEAKQQT